MFLRMTKRKKDGKEHRYWSIVENHRISGGRVVQKHVLYLGEINDSQREAWWRSIEILESGKKKPRKISLFPEGRKVQSNDHDVIHVHVNQMRLQRPRQWGACWMALLLWDQLQLDRYWGEKLPPSRQGTRWLNILKLLTCYRLIQPGSEWKLHREWYGNSAIGDLLGEEGEAIPYQNLYRCLDKLLEHKEGMFSFLQQRWQDMFNADFDVLLYDLTSTYFESDPPASGKRRYGYSRDKRPDCVQVVIALVVTPDGFPLCYEVMAGNTSDRTTLRQFLKKIEDQYGKARRVWIMDRGIPTEEVLGEMRQSDVPVYYLVGTPKGRLNKLETKLLSLPWEKVRNSLNVKLLKQDEELYVLACSTSRQAKERAMRRRRLKRYWNRLKELSEQKLDRDRLLMKIGAAKKEAGNAARLVELSLPLLHQDVTPETFRFRLIKDKLRKVRRQEGQYLLRSNLVGEEASTLWKYYIQLVEVEQAFKTLKMDLSLRPVYHQKDERIEAHIFVAFLSYCLQVTLQQRLKALAPGLTVRSILEKFAAIQLVDVHLPTTDGRELRLPRYTEPNKEHLLLLSRLNLKLPPQPRPELLDKKPKMTELKMHA
ncbi:MAG TPA: IS1634 family transposase [Desulfuromonadales bacterium]|nr:IS1634 family transposase [Desulfuromonadales bacterium]